MRPRKSQLGLFEAIWRPFRFSFVDSHLDGPTNRTSQHVKYQSGFSRRYSIRTYCDSHFAVEQPTPQAGACRHADGRVRAVQVEVKVQVGVKV